MMPPGSRRYYHYHTMGMKNPRLLEYLREGGWESPVADSRDRTLGTISAASAGG
jgi:hypothetical protein